MKDNKETVYTPYTYLIGWSKFNKWYYGSRYATKYKCRYESGCHPKDLWDTYHTSSKVVTAFRKEHGEPDVREIRKTFSNADDAKGWEHRILQRMNVVKNDKWLNGNDRPGPPAMAGEKSPNYIDGRSKDPQYKREKSRKWRENNPERTLESQREYRQNNPEKNREKVRKWQKNNPEKNREKQRRYHAKKKLEKSLQTASNSIV